MFANARYTHEVLEAIDLCKEILVEREFADVTYTISCFYMYIGRFYAAREYLVKSCKINPLNEKLFEYTITMLGCSYPAEGNYFDFNEYIIQREELYKCKEEFIQKKGDINLSSYILYKHMDLKPKYPLKKVMIIDNINIKDFLLGKIDVEISEDIRLEIEKAFLNYNNKEYLKVIDILLKYKNGFYDNHIFKYVYANSLANTEKAQEAIDIYIEILEDYMDCYNKDQQKLIYLYLGDCYFEKRDYRKSYEYYLDSLNLDHEFSNAIFKVAHSLFYLSKINDYEYDIDLLNKSKNYFEKYIEYEKYNWEGYLNLAFIYLLMGEYEKAIKVSERWINNSLPHNIMLKFYNYLIEGYLFLEDDTNVKLYIDRVEEIIVHTNDKTVLGESELYKYYYFKGLYYTNYSYKIAVESFKQAYEVFPTEENYIWYKDNIEPGRTFYLEDDFKTVIRGGQNYKKDFT